MQISVILKVFLELLAPYTSVSLTRFPGTSQVQRSSVPSRLEHFVRSIWRILLHLSHTWGVRSTFFSGFGFPHLENTFRVLGGGGAGTHALLQDNLWKQNMGVGKLQTCAHLTIVCPEDHDALCTGIDSTWKMLAIFSQPDPCPL